MHATPTEFLAAIREALASDKSLGDLIPENFSEDVMRGYLAELGDAIEKKWGANAR